MYSGFMNRIIQLKILVRPYYSSTDPAHNWNHIMRVCNLAAQIAKAENANPELAEAAALCHDLINVPKNDPRRAQASTLSAKEARPLLELAGFNNEECEVIQVAIVQHSFSKGIIPTHPIACVVQDADRLDALGAIGILRCCSVSTHFGSDYFDPDDFEARHRELDDKSFMVDHYQTKLFKLKDSMTTASGKKIAEERTLFMKQFLQVLQAESQAQL